MMVLGIDPGSTFAGWCLLDFTVFHSPLFFDGGKASSPAALFDHLEHEGLAEHIGLVAVEEPRAVFFPHDQSPTKLIALLRSTALSVAHTSWEGGRIIGWAEARGFGVMRVGPGEWRIALVGSSRKGDDVDAKVKATLPRVVRCWPERSSVHVRDAGGVAHFAGRQGRLVPRIVHRA